ncbi:alcohol dehydrogenase catalytic domain-containing protein [Candidatus Poribacteria bacterium]|jgi:L-iditol 2-dehydrogenase|nr:alcohol dehydrogenase catalytic domain-containing protein [Candidatus Poribacteria bacterium]MBT5534508.1 alcohol dehydrogenase catalytic domain-containing protein [Candidatus Poribacteria bacterium]MBT7099610.1 alcohol dehydrogenase catalytic domain-containing protein [Candidatus Poribacteria bacterium]MBT7804271.1 alcohol dehydrogenase catalytic domain-containing protein [Candidatus Poribacteria bacterium]
MRAAQLYGVRDLRIEELDDPAAADDNVLIDITACGVCPSDVRWYTGGRTGGEYPRRLGHEWVGRVLDAGADVEGFAVGDRVVADWRVVCGECYNCRRGVFNYCSNMGRGGVRGGFCERGTVIPSNLRVIPGTVSDEEACFTEPLACCINGARKSDIRTGDDVVVVGAGPIGLLHTQLAKHHGARVIVCDRIEGRLHKALEVGADDAIRIDEQNPVDAVMEMTDGRGANVIVVAVGVTAAAETALEMAGINATVNLFAGFYPSDPIALDPNLIHYKQINLTGSHDFTPHDFTSALKLIDHGIVDVETLISHRLPLEETAAGFETVDRREGLKVVIEIAA